MAHKHIHVHLHGGMFGSETTATEDAGAFTESKHKREGGKFSSTGGGGAAPKPATGAAAFAAKHKGGGESAQEKLDRAREEQPLL